MLKNGNLLIFDNGRYRGWSRIIELNPVNLSVVWEYKKDGFFSYSQGYLQVLENGNKLVTISKLGRVIELDKNNNVVWDWYYDKSIDKDGRKIRDDIYRMSRYDKKFIDSLLIN